MKFSSVGAGAILVATAAAIGPAPAAMAATDCTAGSMAGTVSSVTGAARDYLAAHPGADQAVTAAAHQSRPEAEANLRGYFTANPGEYRDLRGILAPIGDVQQQCRVSVLPPELASAYSQFMAG
jgi:heme-binding protein